MSSERSTGYPQFLEGGTVPEETKSKSIFKSKTFWWNVLSAAAEYSQILPLPPGVAVLIANGINIALRLITKEPVHVVPQ